MADIHDRKPGEGEPILYKEWRFKYKVRQGTGIFKKVLCRRLFIFWFCRVEETTAPVLMILKTGGWKLQAGRQDTPSMAI
jgi:hypothetical protein